MWFVWAILAVLVLSLLFIRPQQGTNVTAGEVTRPKVEQGEEIGVVLGTYWIEDAQTVWVGPVTTVAIKSSGGKK